MWVARWVFVSLILCACLGALHAALAMGETLNKSELRLMPMTAPPVQRVGQWTPPAERLADIVDELRREYPAEIVWGLLIREAARVKHEG